jgi:oxygen-dependent protoporphyrinogen oxidase
VRLGHRVDCVKRRGAGFDVRAGSDQWDASRVVLTCDADAAARLLLGIDAESSRRLAELAYNGIAVVHMHATTPMRAAGYQVALTEPLRTRGVTFNSALFGRDGVLTAFIGGSRDRAAVDESDDALAAIATHEFELVTGTSARPLLVSRTRIPAWDQTWTALDGWRAPDGVYLCANYESRVGIPGRFAAADRLAASIASSPERSSR